MNSAEPHYHVYIVRVWKEQTLHSAEDGWRFTLSTLATSKRSGFTDLATLCDALVDELTTIIAHQKTGECGESDNESGA